MWITAIAAMLRVGTHGSDASRPRHATASRAGAKLPFVRYDAGACATRRDKHILRFAAADLKEVS